MVIIDIMEVHRISWWIRGWKCINVIVMVGQVKRNQVSQDCWCIIYEDREFLYKLKSSCPLTSVFNTHHHHTSFIPSKSEGKSEPHDILFRKDTRDYCVSGFFEWFRELLLNYSRHHCLAWQWQLCIGVRHNIQQVGGARISPVPVSKSSDFLSVTSCHSVSDLLLRLTSFEELPITAVKWRSLCTCTWHKD